MQRIDYSVFSYSPSIITNERINLGVLFHDPAIGVCRFEHTKKWSRIENFDDELDIEFVKEYLHGIKKQLEPSLLTISNDWISFVRRFVNEFKFSPISTVEVEEKELFIEETKKIYLRMDFPLKDRPKQDEQKKFALKLLRGSKVDFSTESIVGKYNELINYDYQINDKCFKYFDFDKKDILRMMQSVHAWRDIATEIKDTCETIFVYDTELVSSPEFKIAIEMLKDSAAKVYSYSQALEYINMLNSKLVPVHP